jgi:hypothetical protein
MALRNAGFGLQFDMVSDDFSATAPNEFGGNQYEEHGAASDPAPETNADHLGDALSAVFDAVDAQKSAPSAPPAAKEPTLDEEYAAACATPCPIRKYEGKTLGDLISLDPKALMWIAEKYEGNPETKAAAQVICEYAMLQAG